MTCNCDAQPRLLCSACEAQYTADRALNLLQRADRMSKISDIYRHGGAPAFPTEPDVRRLLDAALPFPDRQTWARQRAEVSRG